MLRVGSDGNSYTVLHGVASPAMAGRTRMPGPATVLQHHYSVHCQERSLARDSTVDCHPLGWEAGRLILYSICHRLEPNTVLRHVKVHGQAVRIPASCVLVYSLL